MALDRKKEFREILAAAQPDQRRALNKLRRDIQAAAPGAEESIAYGLPAFRLNGKFLVAIGATAKHCAFYLGHTVQAYKKELKKYDTSQGTIRFQPDKPLPSALVRKLVRARIAGDDSFRED